VHSSKATQLAQPLFLADADSARCRHQIAAENFHEGGFAAAIGADQAVTVAITELHRDVLEQGLVPELHGNSGCCDHVAVLFSWSCTS